MRFVQLDQVFFLWVVYNSLLLCCNIIIVITHNSILSIGFISEEELNFIQLSPIRHFDAKGLKNN